MKKILAELSGVIRLRLPSLILTFILSFALGLVILLALSAIASADEPAMGTRATIEAVIPPALRYLEKEALSWKAEMGCASCHHAPMMLWSCETAKSKGFTVNEEAVAEIRAFILDEGNAAKLFPPADAPPDRDGTQIGSIYALLALNASPGGWGQSQLASRTRAHYAKTQRDDGSWAPFPSMGRPPILEQGGASARLMVAAFAGLPAEAATPEATAMVEKAKVWLAQPLESPSHQQEVTQYIAELATGAPQPNLDARQASLLAQQRPDGSWPMVSRPVVGGPAAGSLEPSANLAPITCMGAGWAVVGLLAVLN